MAKPNLTKRWRLWCGQTLLGWWCLGTLIVYSLVIVGSYLSTFFLPRVDDIEVLPLMLAIFISFGYGVFRAAYFHPLVHRAYGEWLMRQPWTAKQALPLGPWHFAAQDAAYLAFLGCLNILAAAVNDLAFPVDKPLFPWLFPRLLSTILVPYVIGYSMIVLLKAAFLREPVAAYSLILFLGALALLWGSPYLIAAFFLAVILASHISYRRMLVQLDVYAERQRQRSSPTVNRGMLGADGIWPYHDLLEFLKSPLVPLTHATLIAASLGWATWSWANLYPSVLSYYEMEMPPELVTRARYSTWSALVLVAMTLAGGRFLIYWLVGTWPFGWLARLKLRQLIVPGYDVVFLGPLATLAIGTLAPPLMLASQVPPPVVGGVAIFLMLLTVLGLGPTLDSWRHVGHHRMRNHSSDRRTKVSTQ